MIEDPSPKEIAQFWILIFKAGWIDKHALIAWADSVLVTQDDPDPALIELSLSGKQPIHQAFDRLSEVKGNLRTEVSAKLLFAYAAILHQTQRMKSAEIVGILHRIFIYDYEDVLPQNVIDKLSSCDHLISLISYLEYDRPSAQDDISDARQKLDLQLQELLDWGNDYRDKLPEQCLPPTGFPG